MAIGGIDSSLLSSQFNLLQSISNLSNLSKFYAASSKAQNGLTQFALFGSALGNPLGGDAVHTGAADLLNKAQKLTDATPSGLFQQKSITVDAEQTADDGAISATANQFATTGTTLDVEVSQLAKAQTNISDSFSGAGTTSIAPGSHTFEILKNGETVGQSYTVNVTGGDSNQTVLQATADAINARDGYTATVEDLGTGSYRLKVTSDDTGADNSFTINDLSGGLAGGLNLTSTASVTTSSATGGVLQASQDALFTVNGVAQQNDTNSPVIQNGTVTLTFNRTTTDNVQLTVGADSSGLQTAIEDFVDAHNTQLDNLNASTSINSAISANQIRSAAYLNESKLEDIGVSVDAGGKLTIDKDKLKTATESDVTSVQQAFTGLSGIATLDAASATTTLSTPILFGSQNALFGGSNLLSNQFSLNSLSGLNSLLSSSNGLFLSFLA